MTPKFHTKGDVPQVKNSGEVPYYLMYKSLKLKAFVHEIIT